MRIVDPGSAVPTASVLAAPDMAMLAHDIRGALQGIVGGMLQIEEAELLPEVRAQFERVAAATTVLNRLVGEMIGEDPGFVSSDTSPTVDLPRLFDYVSRRWSGEAEESGVVLTVSHDPAQVGGLRVDRLALIRILSNLISNSIRSTAKHSSGATVDVSAVRLDDGAVELRVIDDGPGLDPAMLEAKFGAGMAVNGATPPIHGLGLHIVKNLTEGLGGSLHLANHDGGGFAAGIRFPPDFVVSGPLNLSRPNDVHPSVRPDLAGCRVLLAEDNPTNQLVATQMLRALGGIVTVAADGIDALAAFEEHPFDLLLVDIEMPRLSGLDVIRTIRQRGDERARTPIVALTAYALREHRTRIATAGADGLISKPITSIDALGRALLTHLHARKAQATDAPPSSTCPPDVEVPVIDRDTYYALARAIGAETMYELLEKVAADLASARETLLNALDPLACAPVRATSHILISVAGAVGAARLQACAQSLNTAVHNPDTADLPAQVRHCVTEIDAVIAFTEAKRAAEVS